MDVIKPGNGQKGWSTQQKCTGAGNQGGGCGAELRVEGTDLFKTHNYDHGGGHDVYITFRCPLCRVLTDLSSRVSIPSEVREKIAEDEEEWLARSSTRGVDSPPRCL